MLPDDVLEGRQAGREFLKEAFHPPMDAIKALSDMRGKAPATVTVDMWGRAVAYASLWDDREAYAPPEGWTGLWPDLDEMGDSGACRGQYARQDSRTSGMEMN